MDIDWRRRWTRAKIRFDCNLERRAHVDGISETWITRHCTKSRNAVRLLFSEESRISAWENEETPAGVLTDSAPVLEDIHSKTSPVYCIDVHSEAVWCLTGLENGTIHLWTVRQEEGTCVHTFQAHSGVVSVIKISPTEKSFLSGSWDKSIKLWSLDDGTLLKDYGTMKSQITSIEFRPSTSKTDLVFFATSFDGTLYIFDGSKEPKIVSAASGSLNWCLSACWSIDGKRIYCGRKNETVDEIDAVQGTILRTIRMPKDSGWVSCVTMMPNNRQLLW